MSDKYADIIVDISHEKVDRPFQYKIRIDYWDRLHPVSGACSLWKRQ